MLLRLVQRWGPVALSTTVLATVIGGSAWSQMGRPAGRVADASTPLRTREALRQHGSLQLAAVDAATVASESSGTERSNTDPRPTPARRPRPGSTSTESDAPEKRGSDEAVLLPAETKSQNAEEQLAPIASAEDSGPVEIEAASFKGITPGGASLADVTQAWGPSKETRKQGTGVTQLYSVEPFERVEVNALGNKVTSIIVRFERTFAANDVAQQLEMSKVRPVLVSNELGEILGQVYPERGVLFAFEPSQERGKPSMKVAHIILEPISAEPFILRAENDLESRTESSRHDLEAALKLESNNARALWLYARVLTLMGEHEKALTAAADAVRFEPENARHRITKAQILGQMGRLQEALAEGQKALEAAKNRPHVQARAYCLLGDLLASGSRPDYKKAIRYHTDAVKVADPFSDDRHPAVRIAAKEVIVDAHLGAAHDIAWGDWKDKEPAVRKWLERAAAAADNLIQNDGGSQDLRFRVCTRALAACVGLHGGLDPTPWSKSVTQAGEELIGGTRDPARKAALQWDLGMALYDALQVYQMRGDQETALKYGQWAIDYLEQGDRQKSSPTTAYLLGRLYFRLGAIHAVRDQNHRAAIAWFDKAIPLLQKPIPPEALADLGRHGETFVSMGVSYWESGQRDKAVELTQQGVTLMEQAVKQGSLKETALAIPYANLAAMHRYLGAPDKAKRFQELEARFKGNKLR